MNRDSIVLLQAWIDAFNQHDIDAVMACYADDAVNYQVAAGKPVKGLKNIKRHNLEFFLGFPDSWAKIENLMSDGNWASWEWVGGGTFLGEFYGNKPTGKKYELRGCGFFNFRGGRIIYQRGYWDKHTWFSQIGIPIE